MSSSPSRSFPIRPDHLLSSFEEHLKKTGKPHTWKFLSHHKPPTGDIEVLCRDFHIPKEFILKKEGFAPCPICSPASPKYGQGHLIWSRESGEIFAVGHCCGHNYFSQDSLRLGLRANSARRERRSNEDFLELNWDKPLEFLIFARHLITRARAFDQVKKAIHSILTKNVISEMNAMISDDGYLKIDREIARDTIEKGGLRAIQEKYGARPVAGPNVLMKKRSNLLAEARLQNVIRGLENVNWTERDDIYGWLINSTDLELGVLFKKLKDSELNFTDVCGNLNSLRVFLSKGNMKLLNDWSKEKYGYPLVFGLYIQDGSNLSVCGNGRSLKIPLKEILDEVPPPPKLKRLP